MYSVADKKEEIKEKERKGEEENGKRKKTRAFTVTGDTIGQRPQRGRCPKREKVKPNETKDRKGTGVKKDVPLPSSRRHTYRAKDSVVSVAKGTDRTGPSDAFAGGDLERSRSKMRCPPYAPSKRRLL